MKYGVLNVVKRKNIFAAKSFTDEVERFRLQMEITQQRNVTTTEATEKMAKVLKRVF